jgi:hypothetical protein
MAERVEIPTLDLRIDEENPRLPQPNLGQREAFRSNAGVQGRKLLALAKHIREHGLDLGDLPIVMAFPKEKDKYVVLDGNRRLTAIRALENPELFVDAVENRVFTGIRRLSKDYQAEPIDSVMCVVMKDREEAHPWIELRNTSQLKGAANVPWQTDEAARFRARSGGLPIDSQAMNFLERRGDISSEARHRIPMTSYRRLLQTPQVRAKVGIEFEGGKLKILAPEDAVAKALLYIANDLDPQSKKTKTVVDIYKRAQRIKYAEDLPKDVVVTPTRKPGQGVDISSGIPQPTPHKPTSKEKATRPRDKLIPRDCILSVSDERLRDIEKELRRLSLEEYPNAVSVLFRVFFELSADVYCDRMSLPVSVDAQLGTKLQSVTFDLVKRKKLTEQQAKPVYRASKKNSYLGPSITTMHQFVHNPYMFPGPSDLRADWNSLQPWFSAVWSP